MCHVVTHLSYYFKKMQRVWLFAIQVSSFFYPVYASLCRASDIHESIKLLLPHTCNQQYLNKPIITERMQ